MSILKERLKLEEHESNTLLGARRFPIQDRTTEKSDVQIEGEELLSEEAENH